MATNILEVAHELKKRSKLDYDSALAISGEEGSGKSCLAIAIAQAIDPNFNLEESEVFSISNEEIFQKMTNKKIKVLIFDEAIKNLYKQNWMSASQKYLNVLFSLARQENKVVIMCIPRFRDINEFFRNHRVRFWIHILTRGLAVLSVRDFVNYFAKDPWWLAFNEKIIEDSMLGKKIYDIGLKHRQEMLRKCRNVVMFVEYDDFTPEIKEQYLTIIASNKYQGINNLSMASPMETKAMQSIVNNINSYMEENRCSRVVACNKFDVAISSYINWCKFLGLLPKTFKQCLKDDEQRLKVLGNAQNFLHKDNIHIITTQSKKNLNFLKKANKLPFV